MCLSLTGLAEEFWIWVAGWSLSDQAEREGRGEEKREKGQS